MNPTYNTASHSPTYIHKTSEIKDEKSNERRHKCKTCGKGFDRKSRLETHIRTHTGEKPFVCTEVGCGKSFAINSGLTRHIRTHTGKKPFMCTEEGCGRSFARTDSLARHMITHTGEKLFECETCGKPFSQKENLKRHMRTHTGEKPFECLDCGKSFAHNSTLKAHMKTHTGENPIASSLAHDVTDSDSDINVTDLNPDDNKALLKGSGTYPGTVATIN